VTNSSPDRVPDRFCDKQRRNERRGSSVIPLIQGLHETTTNHTPHQPPSDPQKRTKKERKKKEGKEEEKGERTHQPTQVAKTRKKIEVEHVCALQLEVKNAVGKELVPLKR